MAEPLAKGWPGQALVVLADPDENRLAESLVSLANSSGGIILVGVDSQGQPTGSVYAEELEEVLRVAEQQCRPPVVADWEQQDAQGGAIFAIHVSRSPELHSLADGRVLMYTGTTHRPLSGSEIRQLAASKSTGDFEAEVVAGARREDLDEHTIDEYVERREQRSLIPWQGSRDELLQEIGALDKHGRPTVTGVLLFGKNPQAFLPQSGLTFVKFLSEEPRGEGGQPGYGRREEIGGPLPHVIQRAWALVQEEMRVGAVVTGLDRKERPEYPPAAVREALVNAVAHRDYRLRGRRIEIRMFSNRMEISSPGGLPGFITLDNIIDEHFSRNPNLVAGLYQWGYIEELGLGVDLIYEEMASSGLPVPQFRDAPYSFTVTLYNMQERRPLPAWERSMNDRQLRALAYIEEHGRITNREYRVLCPDMSAETLRLDLSDLVDRGLLLQVGAKKGTYYILK